MWHKLYKAIFLPLKCLEVLTFCPLNCQLVFKFRASQFLAFNRLTLISWFFTLGYQQQAGLDFEAGHLKCCPRWWYPVISNYYARSVVSNFWPLIMISNILSILKFFINSILENSLRYEETIKWMIKYRFRAKETNPLVLVCIRIFTLLIIIIVFWVFR